MNFERVKREEADTVLKLYRSLLGTPYCVWTEEYPSEKEVSVSENERISEQFICFYPNILVEYVEKTEKVFDRPITIFEGRIEFDSDVIKNKIDKIIDEYEISFSLSEPEPEKMGKNKYNKHTKKGIAHTYKKYKYKEKNK